eukprot:CAMPEP_0114609622 /NCGR_PEP_ID=MMETSP0168-20121206/3182_1 /TAXON_ID=95228 ORGANISM="Vannella sp., Strain DIVA3 517/6/12" /NCGR_SAMPLE_ID=MMETSP0168 /ASSEMBLY_ACC=CAM_ASM_000044 /LENGTH=213 /DNA_ID=CAMNT_0001820543 /DNA_START=341 /DNA_END=979 /DNA_ORIENTATION=+
MEDAKALVDDVGAQDVLHSLRGRRSLVQNVLLLDDCHASHRLDDELGRLVLDVTKEPAVDTLVTRPVVRSASLKVLIEVHKESEERLLSDPLTPADDVTTCLVVHVLRELLPRAVLVKPHLGQHARRLPLLSLRVCVDICVHWNVAEVFLQVWPHCLPQLLCEWEVRQYAKLIGARVLASCASVSTSRRRALAPTLLVRPPNEACAGARIEGI